MSKTYTDESIKLQANELLLNSKGFMLFTVNESGELMVCADNTKLTPVERRGLEDWRHEDTNQEDLEAFDGEI